MGKHGHSSTLQNHNGPNGRARLPPAHLTLLAGLEREENGPVPESDQKGIGLMWCQTWERAHMDDIINSIPLAYFYQHCS